MSQWHKKRYQYLAYETVRDAIAFWIGIPKFLEESNLQLIHDKALAKKLNLTKRVRGRELTPEEINKCVRSVKRAIDCRVKELREDFKYCEDVLFTDNLWLQWLNLNPEFFKVYLNKLNQTTLNELAVIPKWGINDHSLGRSYINDNFNQRTAFYE